jgi:hypothetical protein
MNREQAESTEKHLDPKSGAPASQHGVMVK